MTIGLSLGSLSLPPKRPSAARWRKGSRFLGRHEEALQQVCHLGTRRARTEKRVGRVELVRLDWALKDGTATAEDPFITSSRSSLMNTSRRPAWAPSGGTRLLLLIRLGLLRRYRRERAEQAVELIVRASSEKQCGGWASVAIVAKS